MVTISLNALMIILILLLAPEPTDIYLFMSLYCFNIYFYYRKLGGSFRSDFERSIISASFWQDREKREMLEHYCFFCRVGLIFGVLFLCSAVML